MNYISAANNPTVHKTQDCIKSYQIFCSNTKVLAPIEFVNYNHPLRCGMHMHSQFLANPYLHMLLFLPNWCTLHLSFLHSTFQDKSRVSQDSFKCYSYPQMYLLFLTVCLIILLYSIIHVINQNIGLSKWLRINQNNLIHYRLHNLTRLSHMTMNYSNFFLDIVFFLV